MSSFQARHHHQQHQQNQQYEILKGRLAATRDKVVAASSAAAVAAVAAAAAAGDASFGKEFVEPDESVDLMNHANSDWDRGCGFGGGGGGGGGGGPATTLPPSRPRSRPLPLPLSLKPGQGQGQGLGQPLWDRVRLVRKNARSRFPMGVDCFPTKCVPGTTLRNAATGKLEIGRRIGRRRDEDLFFKVSICTGENPDHNEPLHLFYADPEEFEDHFQTSLSHDTKCRWMQKSIAHYSALLSAN